jgi:hypothetical protein
MALEEAFEAAVGGSHFWLDAEADRVASQRAQVPGRVTGGVESGFDGGHGFGLAFLALRIVAESGAGDDAGFQCFEVGNDVAIRRFDSLTPSNAGKNAGGAEVFIEVDEGAMDGALGPGGVGVGLGDSSDEAGGFVADVTFVKGAAQMRQLAEFARELSLGFHGRERQAQALASVLSRCRVPETPPAVGFPEALGEVADEL